MGNNWIESVKKTLLPLSEEKTSIKKALQEWKNTNDFIDSMEDEGNFTECELCGHPEIRYRFTIKNVLNLNTLEVSSTCITKFYDETVDDLEERSYAKKKILDSISAHKEQIKKRRVDKAFNQMNSNKFSRSLFNQYKENGSLSPKQILAIHSDLVKLGVKFNDVKMNLRKRKYQTDLTKAKGIKLKILLKYLSPQQLKKYSHLKNRI